MAVKIRPAVPGDVPGLFDVRTSITENAMNQEEMQALGITPAAIRSMIQTSDCAWVAVDHEKIVGFSMIIPEDNCLFAAFVLPQFEGLGWVNSLYTLLSRHFSSTAPRFGWKPERTHAQRASIVIWDGEMNRTLATAISV